MTAPPDDLEATVVKMWTELGLGPGDPTDDFFVLGGQSLTLGKLTDEEIAALLAGSVD